MEAIKVAICQITPHGDKEKSIHHALTLIEEAAGNGARLISLPEIFYYPYDLLALRRVADTDTTTLERLQQVAKRCGVYLCTGSLAVKTGRTIRNTSYLIDPSGMIRLEYSKTHLFDVNFDGLRVRESVIFTPGNEIKVVTTPIGTLSILICYDIRFPEMSRACALKGVEILIVPAAFNTITGPAHWHVLMRARAIENQVFLLAASQARVESSAYVAYGHSLIVDPWGTILAEAGENEEIIYADLQSQVLTDTRKQMPLLSQRRPDLYQV